MKKVSRFAVLFLLVAILFVPRYSNAQTNPVSGQYIMSSAAPGLSSSTNTEILLLQQKVDLLKDINDRTLNSVYWTLGILAAIFLGIISVNLFVNITANKRELKSIREQTQKDVSNSVTSAETRITDKITNLLSSEVKRSLKEIKTATSAQITAAEARIKLQLEAFIKTEIENEMSNVSTQLKNEVLEYKAELTEQITGINKVVAENKSFFKAVTSQLNELEIKHKELEAYKYYSQGRMGGVLNLIEVLNYDISERVWHVKFALASIKDVIGEYVPDSEDAYTTRLKEVLNKVSGEENLAVVKEINLVLDSPVKPEI
jgi:hypothetical protein